MIGVGPVPFGLVGQNLEIWERARVHGIRAGHGSSKKHELVPDLSRNKFESSIITGSVSRSLLPLRAVASQVRIGVALERILRLQLGSDLSSHLLALLHEAHVIALPRGCKLVRLWLGHAV